MRRGCAFYLFCFYVLCCIECDGQYYRFKKYHEPAILMEYGVGPGLMHAFTDIGGNAGIGKPFLKDFNPAFIKPSVTVYLLALYRNKIGWRIQITRGSVAAADSVLGKKRESYGREDRNLHFKSRITEIQGAIECYPTMFRDFGYRDPPALSPYLISGMGYYAFNPIAMVDGKWYELHPLRTEGQGFAEYPARKTYSLKQFNIALGSGLRWKLNENIVVKFEWSYRFLFTDYLDDVSTTYIDPVLFEKYLQHPASEIAGKIFDRRKERNPDIATPAGDQRGNPGNKDSWLCIDIKLGFVPPGLRK